jgi:hypothetical protein
LFHVVSLDKRDAVVQRAKFRRNTLLTFFERAERSLVGMEACSASQWLARKLLAMGHQVRIVPAQFVKPYVKSQKNNTIDAEAIAEAVTRPTMRFTQVRTTEQVYLQAFHRVTRPTGRQPHSADQPECVASVSNTALPSGRSRRFPPRLASGARRPMQRPDPSNAASPRRAF